MIKQKPTKPNHLTSIVNHQSQSPVTCHLSHCSPFKPNLGSIIGNNVYNEAETNKYEAQIKVEKQANDTLKESFTYAKNKIEDDPPSQGNQDDIDNREAVELTIADSDIESQKDPDNGVKEIMKKVNEIASTILAIEVQKEYVQT